MDFQVSLRERISLFLKKWEYFLLIGLVLIVVVAWSCATLVTKPRLWMDEAISIDIAHSVMYGGPFSVQTAPQVFFEPTAHIQSTGYPVTASLAGFFSLFGYGVYQARVYMLLWIVITLVTTYMAGKGIFSKRDAFLSLLLLASFASFYGSGRTVVGEIPGFFFLLAGFYMLCERRSHFFTGILWGFAVVAKPSVFGLVIPTVFFTFLILRVDFFKRLCSVALGMLPAGLLWIFLMMEHPLQSESWAKLGNFYANPFSSSISDNVIHNIIGMFHSTTLIYFGLLLSAVIVARFFVKEKKHVLVYTFILVYSLFSFMYYLRSPGWLRYILIAELLILFVLPHSLSVIFNRIREHYWLRFRHADKIPPLACFLLVGIQIVQMLTVADIFYSDTAFRVGAYLNSTYPQQTIGLLNTPDIALFVPTDRRFLVLDNAGLPPVGQNPLFQEKMPDVVISAPVNKFIQEGDRVLAAQYQKVDTVSGYGIYKRIWKSQK